MRRITPRLMAAATLAAIGLGTLATGTASAASDAQSAASAARSTQIKFHNGTGCQLNLQSYGLDHGIWSQEPPATVHNTGDVSWQSESNGFMTGTEGSVTYKTSNCEEGWRNDRTIRLHWNNPYVGSNGRDTDGTDSGFRAVFEGGGGNNALLLWGEYKN